VTPAVKKTYRTPEEDEERTKMREKGISPTMENNKEKNTQKGQKLKKNKTKRTYSGKRRVITPLQSWKKRRCPHALRPNLGRLAT